MTLPSSLCALFVLAASAPEVPAKPIAGIPFVEASVQGDLVLIRAAENASARPVARLRINTAVKARPGSRPEWREVVFDPGTGKIHGFVLAELLGNEMLSAEAALARAQESVLDPALRLRWAERAAAIRPYDPRALQVLIDAAVAAGQKDRAAAARAILENRVPIHFAICRASGGTVYPASAKSRVELIARYVPSGGLEPVDVGTVPSPAPIVSELAAAAWVRVSLDGSLELLQGTPFANARNVYSWNEPPAGGPPSSIGSEGAKTILGSCEVPGTIYATAGLERARRRPLAPDVTQALSTRALGVAVATSSATIHVQAVDGWSVNDNLEGVTVSARLVPKCLRPVPCNDVSLRVWGMRHTDRAGNETFKVQGHFGLATVEPPSPWVILPGNDGAQHLTIVVTDGTPDEFATGRATDATVYLIGNRAMHQLSVQISGSGC